MCAKRAPAPVDRRQLIVDAARKLFATRPYDKVTTSEITKTAGVAYGLLAHHFGDKRGLYLAVMGQIAAEIAAVQLSPPPEDATIVDLLRHALRSQIAYIDGYSESFVALLRGTLGGDAEYQSTLDAVRWQGAQRILFAIGMTEPTPVTLRTAMHGWIGYLDEMMIDRITNRDIDSEVLVELATAALVSTLRTAASVDPSIAYLPPVRRALNAFKIASITVSTRADTAV